MAWESTGRISVTEGSASVAGTGTLFSTNARVGDGLVGPDGFLYEVANIVSNTSLTISPVYGGATASNQTYKIVPVRGYSKLAADRLKDVTPAVQQAEGIEDWMVPFNKLEAQKAIGDEEPSASGIPRADSSGKLDAGWFSDVLLKKNEDGLVDLNDLKASIEAAADTLVLSDSEGKIHRSRLDVTDIAEAIVATFSKKVQDILSRNTAEEIRVDLELKGASTRDVGVNTGNLIEINSNALIPRNAKQLTSTDDLFALNKPSDAGWYYHPASGPANAPATEAGIVEVTLGSSTNSIKMVWRSRETNKEFHANFLAGRSPQWSDWDEVTFSRDLGEAASRDVGETAGDVMEVAAGGLLSYNTENSNPITEAEQILENSDFGENLTRFLWVNNPDIVFDGVRIPRYAVGIKVTRSGQGANNHGGLLLWNQDELYFGRPNTDGRGVARAWSSLNTTIDSNGFIKAASPIIKLFSDKLEKTEHLEIENAAFERVGTGHYCIKNVPLLSRNGWYIETPKDRNNRVYFTLDYEETEEGLTVKTYTPDYSSGKPTNGDPVDILEGRFVSLRFEEDSSLYPEVEEE